MTKLVLLRGLLALLLVTDVLRAQLEDPTTTVAPVVETTTTVSPVVTVTPPTTTVSTVAPTTTASVVPASTLATTTRGPTTTKANTPTTTSTPEPSETTATPSPSPTTKTSSSTSGRSTFRGFADLDDWVWWVIIGGGSFVILMAVVCCFICIRRGKEKAREEAVQAMEEQREADNHARLLAEAQKQRRDRENQQNGRGSVASNANGSTSETSPAKRPSYYRRPSQGRGAYLATSSSSLQSSALPPPIHTSHHHVDVDGLSAPYVSVQSPTNGGAASPYHPPTSVNERIEALKARNSLPQQKDSYSSEPGFLVQSPPFPTGAPVNQPTNPRDTTLTGYSMDIDGDYESTVGDTFLSPSTKDSLYQELDAAKLNSPTRAAAAAIKSTDSKRSDASDFELDVDGDDDAAQRERVPSHRSIEF